MTLANQTKLVTVFGGSGFVGRHIVRALAKRGYRIRVAVRRPDLAGHVLLRPAMSARSRWSRRTSAFAIPSIAPRRARTT